MSADKNELSAKNITFFTACRENTGKSLCDSGDFYGRVYDKPAIPEDVPIIKEWREGEPATINTAAYLDNHFKIDRKLQKGCETFGKKNTEMTWFELGEEFMKSKGYRQLQRDNVCNRENDLDQVFVYEVWCHESEPTYDDVYNNDAVVTVFYMHCGCDVRGGYGRPIFTRGLGDYNFPVDLNAGYHISEGVDSEGNVLESDEYESLDEQWEIGYSSYPYGKLQDDVTEFLKDSRTNDTVRARLKTGELVTIYAYADEVS
jgi:hypothetical protein